jgi:Tol biopolymer transport system component
VEGLLESGAWRNHARLYAGLVCCVPALLSPIAAPAGGRGLIVYWSMSPIPSIWSIRPDGSARHRILKTTQNAKRARLSPDRKWVAFDGSPPGVAPMSDFDIQVVRLDRTGLRRVTRGSAWDVDAQWSPDGRWLAFSRLPPHASDEHRASIWVERPDGSGLRRVGPGFGARWSPDGTQLAYEAPRGAGVSDLSVIGIDGDGSRPLVSAAGIEQPADWRGTKVLFTRYGAGGGASVFVVGADRSHLRRLGPGIAGSWSGDGRSIVYSRADGSGLLVMSASGQNRRMLVRGDAQEPDWR